MREAHSGNQAVRDRDRQIDKEAGSDRDRSAQCEQLTTAEATYRCGQ